MAEWANIIALIVGPVVAVVFSIAWARVAAVRDRRTALLRQLVTMRYTPGDHGFSQAINMIPLEFNTVPNVMEAWRAYIDAANKQAMAPETTANLIASIMIALGYKTHEAGGTVRSGYYSTGLAGTVNLQTEALKSVVAIAGTTARSAAASEAMLALVQGNQPAPAATPSEPKGGKDQK